MNDQQNTIEKMWSSGNYFVVSHHLQFVSETLCESIDIHATHHALDIACGNGNTALSAARRGAQVIGIDLTSALLDVARERAMAERLTITFEQGDATRLHYADGSFDAVLSTFGVMFVPDRDSAIAEMVRVLKPGGKIGLANWHASPRVDFSSVFSRYTSGTAPANPWTDEAGIHDLLGNAFTDIAIAHQHVIYRFASARIFVESMFEQFGPWKNLANALDENALTSLKQELTDEAEKHNQSGDASLVLPIDYLQIIAVKK